MKKGLKVSKGFYVNLDNICHWFKDEDSMQIQTSGPEECNIIDIVVKGGVEAYGAAHPVEINEFKRIEREIGEYLGV